MEGLDGAWERDANRNFLRLSRVGNKAATVGEGEVLQGVKFFFFIFFFLWLHLHRYLHSVSSPCTWGCRICILVWTSLSNASASSRESREGACRGLKTLGIVSLATAAPGLEVPHETGRQRKKKVFAFDSFLVVPVCSKK